MSLSDADLEKLLVTPTPDRLFALPVAIQRGFSVEKCMNYLKLIRGSYSNCLTWCKRHHIWIH